MLDLTTAVLTSENALQDRIDIEFGDWYLAGDHTDIMMFVRAIYDGSLADRWHRMPPRRQIAQLRWFNRAQGWQSGTWDIAFRQTIEGWRSYNRPLISGSLRVTRLRTERARGGGQYRLRAVLSLNPTRFVAHLRSDPYATAEADQWDWEPSDRNLLTRPRALSEGGEFALDGRDNVLLSPAALLAGSSEHWSRHIEFYFTQAFQLIVRSVEGALHSRTHFLNEFRFEPHLNLRSLETYWEFQVEDALSWVNGANVALRALGSEFSSRLFPLGERVEHVDGHALSHTFRLTDAVVGRVYAKTDRRIRLEITHDLLKDATVIGNRHTTEQPDDLMRWIQDIAEDASRRAGPVLRALRSEGQRSPAHPSMLQLLFKLAHSSSSRRIAEGITMALSNTGTVDLAAMPRWEGAVGNLVAEGLLRRYRPRSRIYGYTDEYLAAGRSLLEFLRR